MVGYENAKVAEIEKSIPNISSLATNAALTAVESKIPDVSSLVKKTGFDTKVGEIEKKLTDHNHGKYITTPEFTKLAAKNFAARLKQANLVTKTDFVINWKASIKKLTQIKQYLLAENESKNLQTFDWIYLEENVISRKMVHKII